ncbi:MAG: hypothetical protein JWM74_5081 [Myxococcaceae bacterium]|jgi:hypothetical protein|nr:hypothetical protein [Myxococcaceae bacterium]
MRILCPLAALFVMAFLMGCGFREVAPPTAPRAEIPRGVEERTSPPELGTTRVLLEANDEKAMVTEVVESSSAQATVTVTTPSGWGSAKAFGYAETTKPICLAPCYADLKPGVHVLRFALPNSEDRVSQTPVQVGDSSKVVRHAVGRIESSSFTHVAAMVLLSLGTSAAAVGGTLWAVQEMSPTATNFKPMGIGLAAGGVGALLIAIPLALMTEPVHQQGSTTELTLDKR